MKFTRRIAFLTGTGALLFLTGCLRISNAYTAIPPGIWRATLDLARDTAGLAEERSGGVLPFNFEVRYATQDSFVIEIMNGDERIVCTDISMGFDRSIAQDTIRIEIPVFGSYITARYEEDALSGEWHDPGRGAEYQIPFRATHGRGERFIIPVDAAVQDFSGKWQATFSIESEDPYPAILVVHQDGNHVTANIATETGDYRYLEGNVEDERMYLSTFDGSHAYLFEAKLLPDGSISGIYRSGVHYKTYWSARKDDSAVLRDPYALTPLSDSTKTLAFSFVNTEGKRVSLDDPRYAGKPKLISFFGSWCPNCKDENAFLSDYIKAHPDPGFEVISIAYERRDSVAAMDLLRRYKKTFGIPWEVLYGGKSNKGIVQQQFPVFEKFIAFPTLLFVDSENRIQHIHTGFYGPATEQYADFVKEFNTLIAELTANSEQ